MKTTEEEVKYPIGIQSFSEIITGGYVYVDKTAYVKRLMNGKYYFLSRPRRFGKSLLLSTLEAYYRGRRELFKGLALDTLTDDWEPHPVLHLDLNNSNYKDEKSLNQKLNSALEGWEKCYGDEKKDRTPEERFSYVIRRAYEQTGKKVVILVDEYDKPLLNSIDNPELADRFRSILKAFYSNLKSMDECIELAMLTGVARFSKVSIFSDLNNLRDISFENEYSGICGVTEEELRADFRAGIRDMAREYGEGDDEVIRLLKRQYDGYHFSKATVDVYNPFSLMNAFAKRDIGSYWFDSGTPTYLVNLVRRINRPFSAFAPVRVNSRFLEMAGLLDSDPVPVFYQSGYLTIKSYDATTRSYLLDYPNEEVKEGFLDFLLRQYVPAMQSGSGFSIPDFVSFVLGGEPERFMESLDSLIASVPYLEKGSAEAHFQNAVYLLFTLLGFYARMEERTSAGRIDLTVETPDYVYIFEFKTDSSAEKAMSQIREREYWHPYKQSGKKIWLIGANFDTSTRRLGSYLIEEA